MNVSLFNRVPQTNTYSTAPRFPGPSMTSAIGKRPAPSLNISTGAPIANRPSGPATNPSQGALGSSVQPAPLANDKTTPEDPSKQSIQEDRATAKAMDDEFKQACETCKKRMYQDGSNDPGVSFKSPANIDPSVSASVVMGHEQEHVAHEKSKAQQEGGKVLYQSVQLHSGICPECGRMYTAGGSTKTVTSYINSAISGYVDAKEAKSGKAVNKVA